MATTIVKGFQKLLENLSITDLQQEAVSTRQQNIRELMEQEMDAKDTFLTGSYKRHTMIGPLKKADIDIFVVLKRSYWWNYDQAGLLDKVKRVLQRAYRETMDISRDGQAVTITFNDFKVDVVPAVQGSLIARFFGFDGFLIANSKTKEWIATNPQKHIEIWSKANKDHDGKLVPLIKMIKAWNKMNGELFSSFHLECLILKIMENVAITDYSSSIKYIFDKARKQALRPVADPAGYNFNVGGYLNDRNKRDQVKSHLETAYARAIKAEQAATSENIQGAFTYWRYIFGDYFPAYG